MGLESVLLGFSSIGLLRHALVAVVGSGLGLGRRRVSIARVYRPVVARVIEPPCGPVDGLLSPLGLRVNHLLSVEQGPVG